MSLKLITLDVTNTILRFSESPVYYYMKIADLYGISLEEEKLESSFKRAFKTNSLKSPNFGVDQQGWFKWWSDVIEDTVASSHATAVNNSTLTSISAHLIKFYSTSEGYEIIPGYFPLIEYLSNRGFAIGAISNTDERLKQILLRLGIIHHFRFVLTSYEAKVLKPHPDIFELALKQGASAASPSEALHIGDTLETDYLGAKTAGWKSILVAANCKEQCAEAGVQVEPRFMVHSLHDIREVLQRF